MQTSRLSMYRIISENVVLGTYKRIKYAFNIVFKKLENIKIFNLGKQNNK